MWRGDTVPCMQHAAEHTDQYFGLCLHIHAHGSENSFLTQPIICLKGNNGLQSELWKYHLIFTACQIYCS